MTDVDALDQIQLNSPTLASVGARTGRVVRFSPVAAESLDAQCDVVVAAHPCGPWTQGFADRLGIDLESRASRAGVSARPGAVAQIDLDGFPCRSLWLLGLGDDVDPGSVGEARAAGAGLGRILRGTSDSTFMVEATAELDEAQLAAFAEGVLLSTYEFRLEGRARPKGKRKSAREEPSNQGPLEIQLVVSDTAAAVRAIKRAHVIGSSVRLARTLANTPSNFKGPMWLGDVAKELCSGTPLKVGVHDHKWLASHGFGGLLAVGGGSAKPPALIVIEHRPAAATSHVVLVGKGITFDSGGLSIKPPDSMVMMKTDMAGAAAVLASMVGLSALLEDELGGQASKVRITALLACAENMPDGRSYRPGDVIAHVGGITSEVENTDAEGRLVLADALAYAATTLKPDVILDVATLTGAATLGLGRGHAAMYATTDSLAGALTAAGEASGDACWRMPLVEEYRSSLVSHIADIRHVPETSPGAGSITAALFLREFAQLTSAAPQAESTLARISPASAATSAMSALTSLAPATASSAKSSAKTVASAVESATSLTSASRAMGRRKPEKPAAWAHLDIAGPGRSERDQGELTRGATGFGVRLILEWMTRGLD